MTRNRTVAAAMIAAVAVGGVAVVAGQVPAIVHWTRYDLLAAVALTLVTLVAELFPLHLRYNTETESFSVTDVAWTAGLLLASASTLLVAVASGVFLSQMARRQPFKKVAFNTGQFLLAMGATVAVFRVLPHAGPLDPLTWAAAAGAMVVDFLVNEALVDFVISLVERQPLRAIVFKSLGPDVLLWLGNVAIDLYRAGQVLMERLEREGDFRPFLEVVARMTDAEAAEIVLLRDGMAFVHDVSGTVSVAPGPLARSEPLPPSAYHRASDIPLQAATIAGPRDEVGSLAVFRKTPLSAAERSLLEALAAQVYVKLRHSEVFARAIEREEELARIIGSSSDGIFVVGEEGRIRSWSPAMERITGVDADRTVGRALWSVLTVPAGEDEVWVRFGNPTYLATDGIETGAFARPDGSVGWVRFSRSVLRSPEGFPVGMVVVARDVSADIQAEQAKTNFIAAISHELRTPLTPLKGYLSLLASGEMAFDAKEARDSFEVMLRHAGRLERLINDLLDASQMEMGRPAIRSEKVDLVQLVADVVAEFDRESARAVLFEPRCARAVVRADRFRTQQVLANVISNAVKHSPADQPVRVETTTSDGVCVVSVTDRGGGIPATEQERIFERFYRVGNSTTQATGGVGLGLYIAKELVESMAGRMWVSSVAGQGSTFSFSLPLIPSPQLAPNRTDLALGA